MGTTRRQKNMNIQNQDNEGSTTIMPAKKNLCWLAAISIIASAPTLGCEVPVDKAPTEEVGKTSSALATSVKNVVAGAANRKVQFVCGKKCTQWRYLPPIKPGMTGGTVC